MAKSETFEVLHKHGNITSLTPQDFNAINHLCLEEGWNIGLHDRETLYQLYPQGHLLLKNDNEIIASIALLQHAENFFTLGALVVNKKYRHQGIGNALWEVSFAELQRTNPHASVLLYAVPSEVERYKKSGFVAVGRTQAWMINSKIRSATAPMSDCAPMTSALMAPISQYDATHYFLDRASLFSEVLKQPQAQGLVFISDNTVKGYGMIRRCARGMRIGPLVADTMAVAHSLLADFVTTGHSEKLFIDVPVANSQALECMQAFGGIRNMENDSITMVKGDLFSSISNNLEKHYGLFSLEIG